MIKTDWTPAEIDALPRYHYDQMVMVKQYQRGLPMYYRDSEGYRWTIGEYSPGNYYKEIFEF